MKMLLNSEQLKKSHVDLCVPLRKNRAVV